MTIDEAIAHARETTENNLATAKSIEYKSYIPSSLNLQKQIEDFFSCAEEREQIAKCLEELKAYRKCKKMNCDSLNKAFEKGKKVGYNKAIDDFCEKLKQDVMATTFGLRMCDVDRIAEQLKAGDGE